jgi:hypothetical protein
VRRAHKGGLYLKALNKLNQHLVSELLLCMHSISCRSNETREVITVDRISFEGRHARTETAARRSKTRLRSQRPPTRPDSTRMSRIRPRVQGLNRLVGHRRGKTGKPVPNDDPRPPLTFRGWHPVGDWTIQHGEGGWENTLSELLCRCAAIANYGSLLLLACSPVQSKTGSDRFSQLTRRSLVGFFVSRKSHMHDGPMTGHIRTSASSAQYIHAAGAGRLHLLRRHRCGAALASECCT